MSTVEDDAAPPMEQSILRSVKHTLGLDDGYHPFDQDLYIWINSAFATLNDIGMGPANGFQITGEDETWHDYFAFNGDEDLFPDVKAYVGLKVRLLFDPPLQSFRITAIENQLTEFLWRIETRRDKIVHPHPLKEVPWLVVAD